MLRCLIRLESAHAPDVTNKRHRARELGLHCGILSASLAPSWRSCCSRSSGRRRASCPSIRGDRTRGVLCILAVLTTCQAQRSGDPSGQENMP